jgi:hypothetical protein
VPLHRAFAEIPRVLLGFSDEHVGAARLRKGGVRRTAGQ